MKILITGGCGFIGLNLIEALYESGAQDIRIFDNESLGRREYLKKEWDTEFLHGDLRDFSAVENAVKGMDCIVHLAADTRVMDSIADPYMNFEVNVEGTMNVLRAMRKAGVERIVNASTGGAIIGEVSPPVHEDMPPCPQSPYGAGKLAVEGYLSAFAGSYGIKACSLRFSNVYGPQSFHKGSVVAAFFKSILEGKPIAIYGDGSTTRDYVYARDLCGGIVNAVQKEAVGVYQLGTGYPTSLNQLVEHIRTVVGIEYPLVVKYENFRPGELRHTWCDIGKARRELDYAPDTALPEGLAYTWAWFLKQAKH